MVSPQQTSLFAGDCSTTNATICALWRTLEMSCDDGEVFHGSGRNQDNMVTTAPFLVRQA